MYEANKLYSDRLPVVPVRGVIFLPGSDVRVEVGRDFSKNAIYEAENNRDGHVLLVFQSNPEILEPEFTDFLGVGLLARISVKIKLPNGNFKIKFEPIGRVELHDLIAKEPFYLIDFTTMVLQPENLDEEQVLLKMVSKETVENASFLFRDSKKVLDSMQGGITSDKLCDLIASELRISENERAKYLLTNSINKRLQYILEDIEKEKNLQTIESKINESVRRSADQNQKEYYLREKMRAIQEELGDSKQDDASKLLEQINASDMPDRVREKALKELKRYEYLSANSSESNVVRTYLETLISIPWQTTTEDEKDINVAIQKLESSHYGLEKVKERIIEYLSVKMLTGKNPQTILCLSGPPGVGKTSLAKSIANALNREFVKTSLGGVHDEAEIRGHRRTYVGALPGRIINGMIRAKVANPVFLIDEIDKLVINQNNDPSSAMLEVLDPEQNQFYSDHYVEEDYDLSQVLFITTANYLENVPAPLRDRMEIIELSSYTEIEKFHIARRFLIKKEIENHGLEEGKLEIEDETIRQIIKDYTREAGVRQLERLIGSITRKAIKEILVDKLEKVTVGPDDLYHYLGKPLFFNNGVQKEDMVGVVTGLAYTIAGGDTLDVEATYYEGKNNLVLTGNLGNVMKESAMAALSYVRSNSEKLGIDPKVFDNTDIHIHVPEGAIPKDGPSAGVTIATALISAFGKKKVNRFVGMTGEITLKGRVLPIGGLKEKAIAASRSGLKKIVIPKGNEKDVEDIPSEVRDVLEIDFAETLEDVLKIALVA
ncbi:MAG TPA: endopeptidase La [Bacillota bacterium]|nr:endopeptidase La [Bacillota bacterium]HPF42451.1 endopeptidase La [Bacillota bacterium]HPJ85709.1 endopeptidase La [Bacillota bacterium]HPQ61654.1 endopeptidase La [Bacillota bacterium]